MGFRLQSRQNWRRAAAWPATVFPTLVMAFVAVMLAGCGGSAAITDGAALAAAPDAGSADVQTQVPADMTSLPSPRELATVGNELLPTASRSFRTPTNNFYQSDFGPGVELTEQDSFLQFTPQEDSLNFAVFELARFIDNHSRVGQVQLGFEWQAEQPQGSEGLYVGVADYVNDVWHWQGPLHESNEFVDFAAEDIPTNPMEFGSDRIVVVNNSTSPLVLKLLDFSIIDGDDVSGDEILFFETRTEPGDALSRVPATDFSAVEEVVPAQPGVEIGRFGVIDDQGTPLLVFNRRADGGDWQVWQVGFDGGMPVERYAQSGMDYQFVGLCTDGSREIVLSQGDGGTDQVMQSSLDGSGPAVMHDLGYNSSGLPIWYSAWSSEVSLAGRFEGTADGKMIYVILDPSNEYDPVIGDMMLPDALVESSDFNGAFWPNAFFHIPYSVLYSASLEVGGTRDIRMYQPNMPINMRDHQLITDPALDLRFPSLSPDATLIAFIAAQPGEDVGELLVTPSFSTSIDGAIEVAQDATGSPAWYDPTPPDFSAQ